MTAEMKETIAPVEQEIVTQDTGSHLDTTSHDVPHTGASRLALAGLFATALVAGTIVEPPQAQAQEAPQGLFGLGVDFTGEVQGGPLPIKEAASVDDLTEAARVAGVEFEKAQERLEEAVAELERAKEELLGPVSVPDTTGTDKEYAAMVLETLPEESEFDNISIDVLKHWYIETGDTDVPFERKQEMKDRATIRKAVMESFNLPFRAMERGSKERKRVIDRVVAILKHYHPIDKDDPSKHLVNTNPELRNRLLVAMEAGEAKVDLAEQAVRNARAALGSATMALEAATASTESESQGITRTFLGGTGGVQLRFAAPGEVRATGYVGGTLTFCIGGNPEGKSCGINAPAELKFGFGASSFRYDTPEAPGAEDPVERDRGGPFFLLDVDLANKFGFRLFVSGMGVAKNDPNGVVDLKVRTTLPKARIADEPLVLQGLARVEDVRGIGEDSKGLVVTGGVGLDINLAGIRPDKIEEVAPTMEWHIVPYIRAGAGPDTPFAFFTGVELKLDL